MLWQENVSGDDLIHTCGNYPRPPEITSLHSEAYSIFINNQASWPKKKKYQYQHHRRLLQKPPNRRNMILQSSPTARRRLHQMMTLKSHQTMVTFLPWVPHNLLRYHRVYATTNSRTADDTTNSNKGCISFPTTFQNRSARI